MTDSDSVPKRSDFSGTWHIVEMEMWDADYFNMETQAHLRIDANGTGDFQFGLVSGRLDGEVDESTGCLRFTWEGRGEMDPVSGSGRLDRPEADEATGRIKFHLGDRSAFRVVRAE
ncbi:MAG: hypothetical protein BRD55_10280 [Bacteroidetes bacterium SW_9_63_38]|nr:MAG: hypothetical protein BRD55_10280 [Bacteroidetes bacterium SW_9_63_38]